MHLLLTRPIELSNISAVQLQRRGHQVSIAPTTEPQSLEHDVIEAQHYIISSQNAVLFGLSKVKDKSVTIFAVGERAAEAAIRDGYMLTQHAETAPELIKIIEAKLKPTDGTIVHLAGAHIAYNISAALTEAGYNAITETIYEAVEQSSPPESFDDFKDGKIDGVIFYSARAGIIFEDWCDAVGCAELLSKTQAIVISKRVADALSNRWADILISKKPSENSLFESAGL